MKGTAMKFNYVTTKFIANEENLRNLILKIASKIMSPEVSFNENEKRHTVMGQR